MVILNYRDRKGSHEPFRQVKHPNFTSLFIIFRKITVGGNLILCENTFINIRTSQVLNMSSVASLKDNAMLKIKPELWREWDFKQNDKLGLDVYKVTKGSNKKAWWFCPKCKSCYDLSVLQRVRGSNCPYCRGYRVNNSNSLASLRPDIANQWHPTKNGDLSPDNVPCGSDKKVWWICTNDCKHIWKTTISNRTTGRNCPYCYGNDKILKGYNDMWTTNPELASLLANPEDGFNYKENSNAYVNWKCPTCGEVINKRQINSINKTKLVCPMCSDGISYPEKVLYNVLTSLNLKFVRDISFKWSSNKRYDAYLEDYNCIIEIHGEHHYNGRFETLGGRSFQEELENDRLKEKLAKDNGIEHYIVIDARESNINYIKKSMLNSELNIITKINEVDWDLINLKSKKSKLVEVCEIYQNNSLSFKDIADKVNLSPDTVWTYLKQGHSVGLCDYIPNSDKNKKLAIKKSIKPVIQLSLDGVVIQEYNSIKEAGETLGKNNYSSISACCKGKAKSAFGYRWMYKNDYNNYISNNLVIPKITKNYHRSREVVRIDEESNKIVFYKTITKAAKENNLNSNSDIASISKCCRGKFNHNYGGYRWMYLEDYEKQYGKIDE